MTSKLKLKLQDVAATVRRSLGGLRERVTTWKSRVWHRPARRAP